ncbi:hypothetical protein JG687_00015385 [Phytophthora cactorum]|uniref:Uncharacterized protein n=1 Tax=Phytophthora cactorum TaxID=29920 RepID=A0A8T1TX08_9STRA|nr:hypothetical protein GQ600_10903 [Phytophthora cactorum]KAG6948589.1 hypothetical protein JG687_00015385 [Phytophthora cactorum]
MSEGQARSQPQTQCAEMMAIPDVVHALSVRVCHTKAMFATQVIPSFIYTWTWLHRPACKALHGDPLHAPIFLWLRESECMLRGLVGFPCVCAV